MSVPDKCEDKIKQLVGEYHDIFEGLEKHKTMKAKWIVDDTVQPIAHKLRRVPYNLQKKPQMGKGDYSI